MIFYGPFENFPVCGGQVEFKRWKYSCTCVYTVWMQCTFSTNNPSRKSAPIEISDDMKDDYVSKVKRLQFLYLYEVAIPLFV
jgi:poly [ADP-ribose] polymerase 2/3/4